MKFSLNKMTKTQKTGLLLLALAFMVCVMLLPSIRKLAAGDGSEDVGEPSGAGASALVQIQDPDVDELEQSKLEAYSSSSSASSKVARYWDDLESEAEDPLGDGGEEQDGYTSSSSGGSAHGGSASAAVSEDELFAGLTSGAAGQQERTRDEASSRSGQSASSSASSQVKKQPKASGGGGGASKKAAPKPGEPGYKEYRMQQYYDSMDAAVQEGEEKKAEIERGGVLPSGGQASSADGQQASQDEPMSVLGDDAPVRKSSAMSDLSSGAGSGFSSLGDESSQIVSESADYPFECMFVRAEKLRSGSRVSVRLLEDMVVGGTLIPKNTHLMAMCSIDDRLQLTISSVEMNQKIFSLGYEAYDTDGSKGIYCPDLMQQDRQKVAASGLSSISSLLGRRVGSIASSAVSTGVSIAQSKTGEVTVSVPAGYRFFIVKKQR